MIFLFSAVSGVGYGGIQVVNRLLLNAAQQAKINGCVVSLHDSPGADWTWDWPNSFCADGSRLRFAAAGLQRREHAKGSIIFVTHLGLLPAARGIKEVSGGKLFALIHGVEAWKRFAGKVGWGLRACDLIVANSNYTLARFQEMNPALGDIATTVCYLPARRLLDVGELHSNGNGNDHSLRVITVGRLWGRGLSKGQSQLITIWPRILESFPTAELFIVGGGAGLPELQSLAMQMGVSGAVTFTSEVSDAELARLYSASAVYAMPSRGEGFGLVFAEAMSNGLPCIASRFDAGAEIVADQETGFHVDPDDLDELHKLTTALLADAGLRERMGESAKKRVSQLFSQDAFDSRIAKLLSPELAWIER
jgi:phosphatidylinositol alpha-1,6-mannosyltransferase